VARDYGAVAADTSKAIRDQYVGLRRLSDDAEPSPHNPTGWTVIYDGYLANFSQPADPCAA